MKSEVIDQHTNNSTITEENQIIVVQREHREFKLMTLVKKTINNKFAQELFRFGLYALVVIILMSIINKSPSSTIYSTVQMQQADKDIFLRKQIPGIFPALSTKWSLLMNKWSIQAIRGGQLQQNFNNQKSYQLEFKHFQDQEKADILYITRDECNGHVMMNWQLYGNNIYFSEFQPPQQGSMIIPNQPQDEKCILGDGWIVDLLRHSTIWTVSEESNKIALFLLIQRMDHQKPVSNNLVLIANQVKKD